jgi:F-type H+-transporting ATPase subunit alpha
MNNNTLEALIKKQLYSSNEETPAEVGVVISVFSGIVIAEGLNHVMYGEKVTFNDSIEGMVFYLGEDHIKIIVMDNCHEVAEGHMVFRSKKLFFVPIPKDINLLLGQTWDTNNLIKNSSGGEDWVEMPIDIGAPGIMERDFVKQSLHTGILAIDALIPIGLGQRELVVGNMGSGKTVLVLDMIISQRNNKKKIYCIYVGIGQKASSIKRVEEILQANGALSYTIIITANASHGAALQYITPYVAMTIAEYLKSLGEDVLIIFDDLTQHAIAYREINLLMKNIPGREAYSGDIFYIHARLLERCGNFLNSGSITGIPIVSTYDLSSYVPTNIISITDGQIFLDNDLFYKGQRPAINIGISVSRLGGAVQSKFMKKVCSSLKLDLASSEELESFLQFTTDVDEETKTILKKGRNIKGILRQGTCSPYELWQEIIMLFTVMHNLIKEINHHTFMKIFDTLKKKHGILINNIVNDENVDFTLKELEGIINAINSN